MPKEERGFKYQKRTKDTLKERANMKGGNYDSYIKPKFKQWKPKEGKNVIRILPPTWDDARHYGLDIFVNFSIGADNQAYLSLSKHDKGADPLAEARREAQKEGEKDLAKKLQPSQRILYWIIDRMDEDEGPLLWAAPFTFDKALSNLCIDEDTKEVIFIDDPAKGRDVRFYREGTMLNTTYDASKMKILKEGNIHEDETLEGEWLDFINENHLPEVLNFYEYDHIKAVFDGQASPSDDDDDEKPVRGRNKQKIEDEDEEKTSRTRQRAKPRDDASDDDENEKPKRRTSSRKSADDDDDDTVEEKPRGRQHVSHRASDPEDDEPLQRSRGPRRDPDDDELEEKPRSRRKPDPEDDDDVPPSTRRTGKSKPDEDEESSGSLRERLAARRRSRNSDDN